MFFLENIWLIPLLPAFGAALMFFFGKKLQKQTVSAVCVGAVALAFVMSLRRGLAIHRMAYSGGQPFEKVMYTWLGSDTGHLTYTTNDGYPARVQSRRRLPARPALQHLAAVRHRRRHADPHLLHRLHGA